MSLGEFIVDRIICLRKGETMLKKIIAVALCLVLVVSMTGISVNASDYCPLSSGDYSGHGSCSLTATTGYAETFVNPLANTTVSATYVYNVNYNKPNATIASINGSSGGSGGCWVNFSVANSSTDRSLNINASHSFTSVPAGYGASGTTDKVY